MILDFYGGVEPAERTRIGKSPIENINTCSAVCLEANDQPSVSAPIGKKVKRGTLLGENRQTPVYSSISGIFRGILELEGKSYFVVTAEENEVFEEDILFAPEERALTEMTPDDIIEAAKKFAITDSRSGVPLWMLLSHAGNNCRRVVIDLTESDSMSAINYRLCIEKARSLVGGAKVLLHATGALKCVFAGEHYRNAAFEAISQYATDEQLFAIAPLAEKYPYTDHALMYALYVKTLKRGETPIDHGVFVVSAETAIALYDAIVSGMPQLDRYISVCGNGTKHIGSFRLPRGMTMHDISSICGGLKKGFFFIEDSRLSGNTARGAISDNARAIISVRPKRVNQTDCISCGKCAESCPVQLLPFEAVNTKINNLSEYCIGCGACQYICPCGIPLLELIYNKKNDNSTKSDNTPEVVL